MANTPQRARRSVGQEIAPGPTAEGQASRDPYFARAENSSQYLPHSGMYFSRSCSTARCRNGSIDGGVITFVPSDGNSQPEAVPITAGEYSVKMPVGDKRVEIYWAPSSGQVADTATQGREQIVQRIPAKYNAQSTLTAEVKAAEWEGATSAIGSAMADGPGASMISGRRCRLLRSVPW